MAASGFVHGEPVTIAYMDYVIGIVGNPDGKRKVCGTPSRPLFDISGNKLTKMGFAAGTRVVLETNGDKCIIIKVAK